MLQASDFKSPEMPVQLHILTDPACAGTEGKEQEPVREGSDVRNLEGTEIGNGAAERVHFPGNHRGCRKDLRVFGEQIPFRSKFTSR